MVRVGLELELLSQDTVWIFYESVIDRMQPDTANKLE